MSRLSIEISPQQHKKIKTLAASQGLSIKDYILNKLFDSDHENENSAITELEKVLLSRIEQSKNSPPSTKTIQQISDEVIKSNRL